MDPASEPQPEASGRRLLYHAGKAGAVGVAVGLLIMGITGDVGNAANYLFVSCLCSLVIGMGFHALPAGFLEPSPTQSPQRAVALMQAKWLGICLLLLGVILGVLRLRFGAQAVLQPTGLAILLLTALLVTSLAVGQHTALALLARSRSLAQAESRAGFLAIQAQLQPHTLFNALNTILALIRAHPEDAEAATRALSRLLRTTTTALDQTLWPLREEFRLLEALLELERLRFGERLCYELRLPEALEDLPVPPLLLLPLVENSLKHGFRAKVGTCALSVSAEGRILRVEDDGLGAPQPLVEGVGLRTVRERLEAYGGRLRWPAVPAGCLVELELP